MTETASDDLSALQTRVGRNEETVIALHARLGRNEEDTRYLFSRLESVNTSVQNGMDGLRVVFTSGLDRLAAAVQEDTRRLEKRMDSQDRNISRIGSLKNVVFSGLLLGIGSFATFLGNAIYHAWAGH